MTDFALIAGSGFEHLGFEVLTRSPTKTPYGEPSSAVLTLAIRGARVPCIVRHGEDHRLAPHEINGVTQGPRLETAAEIERLARDGCGMVGMTAMPEAALARELKIDYAICAVAVNHAADRHGWRECRKCREQFAADRHGWRECRKCREQFAAGRSPDGAALLTQIERFTSAGLLKARAVLEQLAGDGAGAM